MDMVKLNNQQVRIFAVYSTNPLYDQKWYFLDEDIAIEYMLSVYCNFDVAWKRSFLTSNSELIERAEELTQAFDDYASGRVDFF